MDLNPRPKDDELAGQVSLGNAPPTDAMTKDQALMFAGVLLQKMQSCFRPATSVLSSAMPDQLAPSKLSYQTLHKQSYAARNQAARGHNSEKGNRRPKIIWKKPNQAAAFKQFSH